VLSERPPLLRRLLAELLGTGALVAVVVGSGIAAARLSPDDVGLQLLENAAATGLGLFVLILVFCPVSGAHFNPVVSLADALLGRRSGGLALREVPAYSSAQAFGGIGGAVLANLMFDLAPVSMATTDRAGADLWLSEVVATTGLLLVIFCLARSGLAAGSPALTAGAVGSYIGGAYFFTSSTSFANPAVTLGRAFSDTFAGIAPGSVPGYVLAQLVGLVVGVGLSVALYPARVSAPDAGADVLVPPAPRHDNRL
jgi:arsenate reductase